MPVIVSGITAALVVIWITNAAGLQPTLIWVASSWLFFYLILYASSLALKPYVRCPRCKGTGRFYGWLFRKSFSLCPRCEGRGRVVRWGRRMFFEGPDV